MQSIKWTDEHLFDIPQLVNWIVWERENDWRAIPLLQRVTCSLNFWCVISSYFDMIYKFIDLFFLRRKGTVLMIHHLVDLIYHRNTEVFFESPVWHTNKLIQLKDFQAIFQNWMIIFQFRVKHNECESFEIIAFTKPQKKFV